MRYLREPLAKAAKYCVEELFRNGGMGGVIALDNKGHGMFPTPPATQVDLPAEESR